MLIPLEEFIRKLEEREGVSNETLKDFLPPRSHPKTAEDLARELVRQGKLTRLEATEICRAVIEDLKQRGVRPESRAAEGHPAPNAPDKSREPAAKLVAKKTWAISSKVAGVIFGTIIAPVLVAFLLKWLDRNDVPAPAPGSGTPAAEATLNRPHSASEAVTSGLTDRPRTVGKVTRLFNQHDLTGFNVYITPPKKGAPPSGKNKDPDKVFSVRNGELRVSGEHFGTLTTTKDFDNYHLTVEFRWGEKNWPPREERARNSGILLHCAGTAGVSPRGIGCQVMEGSTGDILLPRADSTLPVSLSIEAEHITPPKDKSLPNDKAPGPRIVYRPGEPLTTFTSGYVHRTGNRDPRQDVKGFHRPGDIELPSGEWNRLECTCLGDRITIWLNGKVVNQAVNVTPRKGKIAIQSEGSEIFFRTINLQAVIPN